MRNLFVLFLIFNLSNAQMLSTSGSQIIDDNNQPILLRGIGLGGWMLQEGYMMNSNGAWAFLYHSFCSRIKKV